MVASVGESAFVSGAVVMAKNQAVWGKAELKRFNMVLLLIMRLYELNLELEGNKRYADTIVASVDTAVLAFSQNGFLIHFNKAAERLFGFPASQAIGKHYLDLSSLNVMKLTKNTFDYVLRKGIPWEGEFIEFTRLDNRKILMSPSVYPWFGGDGGKLGIICVIRDETQIKRLRDQLVKSERMEILGKIASKVSDDIKSPLSSIKNLARMIGDNIESGDRHKNYPGMIIGEAYRINSAVNALL
jgi:PAS domain S-box-containing protein